jgi:hypothetical protein
MKYSQKAISPFKQIKTIHRILFILDEERVVFTLNDRFPPEISSVQGEKPKILCDFSGIHPQNAVAEYIKGQGKFIRHIAVQYSGVRTRVVVELFPEYHYDIHQVFVDKYFQYALMVRKMSL